MNTITRRRLAVILILLGLIALVFGIWTIIGLFLDGGSEQNLPGVGTPTVKSREQPEPQTFVAPVTVEGDSSATAETPSSDIREAINKAKIVVERMWSGASPDGFRGFEDVQMDGTNRFIGYIKTLQREWQSRYPADGAPFGMTTRVISADVSEGEEGSDRIVIRVQSQRVEDAGNPSEPTAIIYEEHMVTLLRESGEKYLVDEIRTVPYLP